MISNQEDIEKIWIDYKNTLDINKKQKLILHYSWLVKYTINKMVKPTNTILEDNDYISVGMIALSDSIDRFDVTRGIKFETYAVQRIRGIVKDELRRIDYLSRSTRKKVQDFNKATERLKLDYNDLGNTEDIRKSLNVSQEKFKSYIEAINLAKSTMSLNELGSSQIVIDDETYNLIEEVPDEDNDFFEEIDKRERSKIIFNYLNKLKEKHRIILTLYYFENLTFKEIGKILDISESRVSQIHSQLINDMKKKLSELNYA